MRYSHLAKTLTAYQRRVGCRRVAVLALFRQPPSEPDVRLSSHPALQLQQIRKVIRVFPDESRHGIGDIQPVFYVALLPSFFAMLWASFPVSQDLSVPECGEPVYFRLSHIVHIQKPAWLSVAQLAHKRASLSHQLTQYFGGFCHGPVIFRPCCCQWCFINSIYSYL